MEMSPEMDERMVKLAPETAQMCANVSKTLRKIFDEYAVKSQMTWTPQKVWMYSGGDWTLVVGGNQGVFVETAKADFNELRKMMSEG